MGERDWTITDIKDRAILESVAANEYRGAWRPWHGQYARAKRLVRNGLLKEAGTSAMPPHVLYVLTEKGHEELAIVARANNPSDPSKGVKGEA
jgi:DNA-binding PadR family transcriptional regulator